MWELIVHIFIPTEFNSRTYILDRYLNPLDGYINEYVNVKGVQFLEVSSIRILVGL